MAKEKPICKVDGCHKRVVARGWCSAHYHRWRTHGDPLMGGTMFGKPGAFVAAASTATIDDCIIWPFCRNRHGYGEVRIDGRRMLAHRAVCIAAYGEPPTPYHQAAHLCGNGHEGCVNWRHLAWKTASENCADKLMHGTDHRGEKHGMAKLTEADVMEIRRLRGEMTQADIGTRFGIANTTVCNIQSKRSWYWLL